MLGLCKHRDLLTEWDGTLLMGVCVWRHIDRREHAAFMSHAQHTRPPGHTDAGSGRQKEIEDEVNITVSFSCSLKSIKSEVEEL